MINQNKKIPTDPVLGNMTEIEGFKRVWSQVKKLSKGKLSDYMANEFEKIIVKSLEDGLKYQKAKEFMDRYFSQDNRGTAFPIYFSIRDFEYIASYQGDDADRYACFCQDNAEIITTADDLVDLVKNLKKIGYDVDFYDDDIQFLNQNDIEKGLKDHGYENCIVFGQRRQPVFKGMFLFEDEAENHLKKNAHHYSDEARTYCHHAWRAPETQAFFELFKDDR